MKQLLFSIWSFVLLFSLASCHDDDTSGVTIAPVSNIRYEVGNGSILFKWDNPDIGNLAYVEISYKGQDGELRRTLVKGGLSECLVNGFGSSNQYEFKFLAYNTDGLYSSPVVIGAAPQEPLLNIFNTRVKVSNNFGGVNVSWENDYDVDFYINVSYTDLNGNYYPTEILAPGRSARSQFVAVGANVSGAQTIDVYTMVSDVYGNEAQSALFKFHKLEAGKLDRSLWAVADFSSQNGDAPAKNLLDDDSKTIWHAQWNPDKGFRFPHHVTFDLGGKKRIEKAEFQQRGDNIMAKGIELWGNNVSGKAEESEWTFFGNIELSTTEKGLQPLQLPLPAEYRYVKVVFTTPGPGNASYAALATFVLYGMDIAGN